MEKQTQASQAIAHLKQGNLAGLDILMEQYQLPALRAAYLIVGSRPLAEDIVQNAFIRLVQKIHQFDSTRPFAPWFLRSVINDAIKAAGRQKRQVSLDSAELSQSIALIDSLADPQPGPEDQFIDAERCQEVWQAIHRLPPEQRAAIVQRYYLGCSEADMSAYMQRPAGTVKWLLHAARHKLRILLAAYTMPPETEVLSEYAEYKED